MNSAHICSYLTTTAFSDPSRPLFSLLDGKFRTASQVLQRVTCLSRVLTDLRLSPRDRVALLTLTTASGLEALLAACAVGCIACPLNWRWTPFEASKAANVIKPRALVCDADCISLAQALLQNCPSIATLIVVGDSSLPTSTPMTVETVFAEERMTTVDLSTPMKRSHAHDDAAAIIFTSGTNGDPKPAVLTHTALHAQTMNKLLMCAYNSNDIYLHTAPWYHVGGLSSALAALSVGAHHIFMPKFNATLALHMISTHNVTAFIAVPTMITDIVSAAAQQWSLLRWRGAGPFVSVRHVLVGAGGMPPGQLGRLKSLFPKSQIYAAYGMTETTSSLTFQCLGPSEKIPELPLIHCQETSSPSAVYVGRPPPGVEVAIWSEDQQMVVSQGQGEIVTRGPHVMFGYFQSGRISSDWLHTGDLGILHGAHLWLIGRAKDIIKTGGEGVSAWEVEHVLSRHPEIAAVCVVGMPDQRLGEIVTAALVLHKKSSWSGPVYQDMQFNVSSRQNKLNIHTIQSHCRESGLAGFKVPRVVCILKEFPVNSTGKVLKIGVKERIQAKGGTRSRL